jgi:amidase
MRPVPPRRVAFSPDLGGITPVDAEVATVCRRAAMRFGELGAEVVDGAPDLGSATEAFTALRAAQFAATKAPLLERHRDLLKPEVIWNIEHGCRLDAGAIGRAERQRGALQRGMAEFLENHDLLLCPAAIVPPFPCGTRFIEALNGHRFPSYIDWVAITYAITLSGCPALALPCGFTASGLPVGLQLVGPPRGEAKLLAAAALLEDLLGVALRAPIDPRG